VPRCSSTLKFYYECRRIGSRLLRLLVKKTPKLRSIRRTSMFKFMDLREMDEDLLGYIIRHSAHILDKVIRRKWVQGRGAYSRKRLEKALMVWQEKGFEKTNDILWAECVLEKFDEWNEVKTPIIPKGKKVTANNIYDALRQRRSIRCFKDKDIEQEKIMKILEAGRHAPCSGNRQSWTFIVKKRFRGPPAPKSELSFDEEEWRRGSVLIYVAVDERPYGKKEKYAAAMDAAAAIQNMLLMAHYLGLGGCWTYLADLVDQNRLRTELGLKAHYYLYSAVLLGYPMEYPSEPCRKPLDKVTKFIGL